MPTPGNSINRYPRGFLSLLDGKTDGRTPQRWTAELQCGLDLSALYLNSFKEYVQAVIAGFATPSFYSGALGQPQVPDDEIWVVHTLDVSSSAALSAGVTIEGHPAINWGGGLTPIKAGSSSTYTAGKVGHWGSTNPPFLGLIALPKWQLGFMANAVTVGGDALTVTAWVTKLKI